MQTYLLSVHSATWKHPRNYKDHATKSFLSITLSVFLFLFHPGQPYLVQFLHGLSAFLTAGRHQGHSTVQSARQRPLHVHCNAGDQRG